MRNSFISKLSAILTPYEITISDVEIQGNTTYATVSKGEIKRYIESVHTKDKNFNIDPQMVEEMENDCMREFVRVLLKDFQ